MAVVKRPFTVLIEGNIGVGKSTFIQYFKQFETVEIIPEPVDAWRNLNGANMLDLVYKNAEKWAFPFQSYAMLLMLQNHLKHTEKTFKIMERSLYSAKHCFVEVLTQRKQMKKEEQSILNKWYEFALTQFNVMPDLIVYLRTTPRIAYDRIQKRQRGEECNVTLEYIEQLHYAHENWLITQTHEKIPVLILDASLSADEMRREYEKCARIIKLK